MFLDEELENVYKEKGDTTLPLLRTALNRLPDPKIVGVTNFLNTVKQIDGSWKLFCKRHPYFDEDIFRWHILYSDEDDKLKKALNW